LLSLPLSSISTAATTLKDGYGNTTDRAVLLYSILKLAGFKPEFVLASNAPRLQALQTPLKKSPIRQWFNTVLVRVANNGNTVYLNDTNQYAILGATRHNGRPGICLTSGEIITINASPGKEDQARTTYTMTLMPDSSCVIKQTQQIYGTAFQSFHRGYAEMPPEERRRHYQEMVAAISQSAKAKSDLITQYKDYPAFEEFSVTIDQYAVIDGDYYYFTLPDSMSRLLSFRSDTRTNPIYWDSPSKQELMFTIKIPDGYHLCFPEVKDKAMLLNEQLPSEAGTITVKAEQAGDILKMTYSAETLPAQIDPEAYGKLLDIQRRLSHPRMTTIILRKK
jgi:hypothetical protein